MQGWRFLPCLVPEPVLIQAPCVYTKRRSPIVPSFLFSRSGGDDDDSSGFVERILIYIHERIANWNQTFFDRNGFGEFSSIVVGRCWLLAVGRCSRLVVGGRSIISVRHKKVVR